jgi:hypothetical protein
MKHIAAIQTKYFKGYSKGISKKNKNSKKFLAP